MYTVVIPVLNEEENLKELLPKLVSDNCEVIVCDNGSTDNSRWVAEFHGARVSIGTGSVCDAILRGIQLASNGKIVVMDGDGSHPPELVREIVDGLDYADLVIGSRYCNGGRNKDSWFPKLSSYVFNILSLPLNPSISDRSGGLFGLRRELASTKIRKTTKPMLEYLLRSNPRLVSEIPYTFEPRKTGKSKLGRTSSTVSAVIGLGFLYLYKFRKLIKYSLVGGSGVVIYLATLAFFTEVVGLWYMFSGIIGAFLSFVWNFTMHSFWTFSQGKPSSDSDYEWTAWYHGNPLQKWWKRGIGRLTKSFIGDPRSLLDVGCGSSPLINKFSGYRVGLDRSQAKLDFIGKYSSAKFYSLDLDRGFFMDRGFEAIICNNVLEHLSNPGITVRDMSRHVVPGGVVVITVPDSSHFLTRFVEFVYRFVAPRGYADEHIVELTPQVLDEMCVRCGLHLVSRKYVATDMVCKYVRG